MFHFAYLIRMITCTNNDKFILGMATESGYSENFKVDFMFRTIF